MVELSLNVAPDLRTVTGRESVVFTPDMRVYELVFRAWPNNPTMFKASCSLTVTDTSVDGRVVTSQVIAAGPTSGTTTHRFTTAAVRDLSVAIGRYDLIDREVGGARLHLATPQADDSFTLARPVRARIWEPSLSD
ncbi:MAG TPA: hypothetical protein VNA67_05930 [Pseudonocardiaceae bacterium]|nr:hypothetical protein [Pseudonocardiaceae bacterium]